MPLFSEAQILPLQKLLKLASVLVMFKIHHELVPAVIYNIFTKRHNCCTYDTRQKNTYELPNIKIRLAHRSVFHHGPVLFNTFLRNPDIGLNTSVHVFKRKQKALYYYII